MNASVETGTGQHESRLAHFPITFFATVMGMLGLTLALHAGERAFGLSGLFSNTALIASVALLVAVAALYGLKLLTQFRMAAAEWHHPVRLAFFPTVSISLILLATALVGARPALAEPIWIVGTVLQGGLALLVISDWIGHRDFKPGQMNAAWFIPAVGNILVPIAGAPLGYLEISWLFFSGGLVFWVVLLTLVMNRLTFHEPLPSRLQPTLVILIAPPAVGFLAWMRLNGEMDQLAMFLIHAAYVFALIVATQLPKILRLPFALSFWALSFPLAALTVATFVYAEEMGSAFHKGLGAGLLALLIAVIAALVARTGLAIARGEICRPE
ncbi:SLAC1 anion channel family protein [Rhodovulum steppense]|uniref:Tellurite resistance protein n=1 Tax=Rhodovulum steppense TaxID=540251 RepID=A0A4R1YXQ8_9RHOB|nr:SLAC1 anion channel family protein [Rhodovulum steppense]TCM85817.1 tellurite resistance protein [Rhodovulum steppense]